MSRLDPNKDRVSDILKHGSSNLGDSILLLFEKVKPLNSSNIDTFDLQTACQVVVWTIIPNLKTLRAEGTPFPQYEKIVNIIYKRLWNLGGDLWLQGSNLPFDQQ